MFNPKLLLESLEHQLLLHDIRLNLAIAPCAFIRDHKQSSMSLEKGNSLQRGAGGSKAHSYFLYSPGDVDFKF